MSKKIPKKPVILISLLLVLAAGGFVVLLAVGAGKRKDLSMLSDGGYDGVFLSMYDISSYPVENFPYYLGLDTFVKTEHCIRSTDELDEYLSAIFSSGNEPDCVYIGLEPVLLWKNTDNDIKKIRAAFEAYLFPLADACPETSFEFYLSYPSMEHWLSVSEQERSTAYVLYQEFAQLLDGRANLCTYYVGGQEWLIQSSDHYLSDFTATEEISEVIFLLTHNDDHLKINSGNAAVMLAETAALVQQQLAEPSRYPDLSGWDIVFLGDSVIGNYSGPLSIPGVIHSFSGASVFNCAQGGALASHDDPNDFSFPDMADSLLSKVQENHAGENGSRKVSSQSNSAQESSSQPDSAQESSSLSGSAQESSPLSGHEQGVLAFSETAHDGKQLCFVINYGLNDYYCGRAVENPENPSDASTYTGGLRNGISALREAYPDALFILMSPGKTTYFQNGTEPQSEAGSSLEVYRDACASLAEELNILFLDFYHDFPKEGASLTEVLSDGAHYNEYGRYLAGLRIVDFLSAQLPQ